MKMKPLFFYKSVLFTICISLIVLGLAYIWHYIPASDWTGVQPPSEYANDEGWYAFNEITGWALLFSGFTTFFFSWAANKKLTQPSKYIFSTLIALFISVLIASLGAELVTNILIE